MQENEIMVVQQAEMLQALNRSEVDIQIATAKQYPRDLQVTLNKIETYATMDKGSDFLQRKAYYLQIWIVNRLISNIKNCAHICRFLIFNFLICRFSPNLSSICPPR